jgi:hypothetical protein
MKKISRLIGKKKERDLWQLVSKVMSNRWHATRHEDRWAEGIPDVSYGIRRYNGWLELKSIDTWPKKSEVPVNIGLSPEQRSWLSNRQVAGGHCYLLLAVGNQEFLLFNRFGQLGSLTRVELRAEAVRIWSNGLDRLWEAL